MTDAQTLAAWRDDERALAAIGAALFAQDTTCRVRLPRDLVDLAVAAWRRTDQGDPTEDDDREHEVVRERAAALALLGAQLDGPVATGSGDVEATLDAWYIGVALGAADDLEMLGPSDAPTSLALADAAGLAAPAAAGDAGGPIGFSLWLEFEHVAGPVTDFCNVGVTCSDGRAYALNVWTFDFVQSLADGAAVDDTGEIAAGYARTPDLLVRELSRGRITTAVAHLLEHGGLPESCRV